MTATIQTIPTADGPFTLLTDDRGRVLASGWSADPAAILGRIALAPADVREGDGCRVRRGRVLRG
jgi:methylated-DNA-[protein]-cysteine S-methyltransferase